MKHKINITLLLIFSIILINTQPAGAEPYLRWNAVDGAIGYNIYYGISIGDYPQSAIAGNVIQYDLNDFSLNEGTTYYFVVRAYNSFGESGDSNVTTYTVPSAEDTTPPVPPQSFLGIIENENIRFTWTPNVEPDISGYRVYYGTASRDYGLPIPVSGTEYTLTGLEAGTSYYMALTALDTSGNESGFSSPEIILAIPAPEEGPVLKWNIEAGETTISGYRIYYSTTQDQYTTFVEVGNVTQYLLSNLPLNQGVLYYFVVRAFNDAGESNNSNITTYTLGESEDNTPPVIAINSPSTEALYNTSSQNVDISGTASDTGGLSQVSWNNSRGGEGVATGTTSWSVSGITLAEGSNVVTVTATDDAGNTSTDSVEVVYTLEDTVSPVVSITSPTSGSTHDTQSETLNLSGTASDAVGVTQISWNNSRGGEGVATGTTSWSAGAVTLSEGENIITVTAADEAGNTATDSLTVVYTTADTGGYQVSVQISYGIDDIEEHLSTGRIDATSSDLELADDGVSGKQLIGLRFRGLNIPNGAIIQNAYIEFETDEAKTAPTSLQITAEASDNAPVYTTAAYSLSSRNTLADSVAWNNIEAWSAISQKHQTPDISTVVQTIINRAGWVSGNALSIIMSGSGVRTAESFEGERPAAASLHVEYTLGPPPDTTAPSIVITSPTGGLSYDTTSGTLNLGGTASDAVGVTQISWNNSRGGEGVATGTTSWSAGAVLLAEGENIITVTAADEAGNTATDSLTVVYTIPDITAPVVSITSPTSGSTHDIQSETLNLSGTASDAVGVTQISWNNSRGGEGVATGTTSWSAGAVILAEGENIITVTAADGAGNTATDSLTVVYTIPDITAPVVSITSPTSGSTHDTQSETLNLSGTASDAVGVTQISWNNSRGGEGVATGTTSWSASTVTLAEGENIITVTAADGAGNTAIDSLTVVYTIPDITAPVVSITSPTLGSTHDTQSETLNLSGTASDAVGVTQISWNNSRGGEGVATGTTSWSAGAVILAEGENIITVTAADGAGNTATDSLTVVYTEPVVTIPDTQAPVLTVQEPTSGGFLFTRVTTINISGTVSDNEGIKEVRWSIQQGGSGVATGTSSWQAIDVPLTKWWNNFVITAEDESGNTTIHEFTVFSWQ